jgi:SAM-dependent methyltransferase
MGNETLTLKSDDVRTAVRESYGKIAVEGGSCCAPGCCSIGGTEAEALGYSATEVSTAPEGANLGLGCGNPLAIASLKAGEVVLDLGSGAGFDCFLASKAVGEKGRVIGVDMTAEMIARARGNAAKGNYGNVEFRLGEIEHLPVADRSVDVIISNCVINLSPDKEKVIADAFRVLKPGGRLAISDIVALKPLPEEIRTDLELHCGCMAGASVVSELKSALQRAGFEQIKIEEKAGSREFIREWAPGRGIEDYVASATIEAIRPKL